MHHGHAHPSGDHGGTQADAAARARRLWTAFALTFAMMLIEAVGGWWTGSLALLTDAAHMFVDALALFMAAFAIRLGQRPADARRSYGYGRLEVLAGFANAILQIVLIAFILSEAVQRLWQPGPILSGPMLWVAVAGLVINGIVLTVLHDHAPDDVNMGGAVLHVLGDLLGSVGAITAALLIGWFGWLRADPLLSILVALLILRSAWSLLRRSGHILLEGVPEGLELARMPAELCRAHAAIRDVHHLHVWQLASGSRLATFHATLDPGADVTAATRALQVMLKRRYRIDHATIQTEFDACLDDVSDAGRADPPTENPA